MSDNKSETTPGASSSKNGKETIDAQINEKKGELAELQAQKYAQTEADITIQTKAVTDLKEELEKLIELRAVAEANQLSVEEKTANLAAKEVDLEQAKAALDAGRLNLDESAAAAKTSESELTAFGSQFGLTDRDGDSRTIDDITSYRDNLKQEIEQNELKNNEYASLEEKVETVSSRLNQLTEEASQEERDKADSELVEANKNLHDAQIIRSNDRTAVVTADLLIDSKETAVLMAKTALGDRNEERRNIGMDKVRAIDSESDGKFTANVNKIMEEFEKRGNEKDAEIKIAKETLAKAEGELTEARAQLEQANKALPMDQDDLDVKKKELSTLDKHLSSQSSLVNSEKSLSALEARHETALQEKEAATIALNESTSLSENPSSDVSVIDKMIASKEGRLKGVEAALVQLQESRKAQASLMPTPDAEPKLAAVAQASTLAFQAELEIDDDAVIKQTNVVNELKRGLDEQRTARTAAAERMSAANSIVEQKTADLAAKDVSLKQAEADLKKGETKLTESTAAEAALTAFGSKMNLTGSEGGSSTLQNIESYQKKLAQEISEDESKINDHASLEQNVNTAEDNLLAAQQAEKGASSLTEAATQAWQAAGEARDKKKIGVNIAHNTGKESDLHSAKASLATAEEAVDKAFQTLAERKQAEKEASEYTATAGDELEDAREELSAANEAIASNKTTASSAAVAVADAERNLAASQKKLAEGEGKLTYATSLLDISVKSGDNAQAIKNAQAQEERSSELLDYVTAVSRAESNLTEAKTHSQQANKALLTSPDELGVKKNALATAQRITDAYTNSYVPMEQKQPLLATLQDKRERVSQERIAVTRSLEESTKVYEQESSNVSTLDEAIVVKEKLIAVEEAKLEELKPSIAAKALLTPKPDAEPKPAVAAAASAASAPAAEPAPDAENEEDASDDKKDKKAPTPENKPKKEGKANKGAEGETWAQKMAQLFKEMEEDNTALRTRQFIGGVIRHPIDSAVAAHNYITNKPKQISDSVNKAVDHVRDEYNQLTGKKPVPQANAAAVTSAPAAVSSAPKPAPSLSKSANSAMLPAIAAVKKLEDVNAARQQQSRVQEMIAPKRVAQDNEEIVQHQMPNRQ